MSQTLGSGTSTVTSGGASIVPIGFGYYPNEGSRCVTEQFSWATQLLYLEDLSQLVARGVETTIQSVYIDNSTNPNLVQLIITGSQQVIVCPGSSQGIFPVFFTGTPFFQISCAGLSSGVTRLCFLNVLAPAGVWNAAISPIVDGGNKTAFNVFNSAVIKTGPGRLGKVIVIVSLTGGPIVFSDDATIAGQGNANALMAIPAGTAAGAIFTVDMPFSQGLALYNYGATAGDLTISYT